VYGNRRPAGSATLNGSYDAGNISMDIGFPSGDSFQIAPSTIVARINGCTIIGTVTGGSGAFTNATALANLTYAPCGPQEVGAASIVVTGPATIKIPNGEAFSVIRRTTQPFPILRGARAGGPKRFSSTRERRTLSRSPPAQVVKAG
jgi:hypothetical protein